MIISNDAQSSREAKGKEECLNCNIVHKETMVSWHHSIVNYEAAQKEMIQLSNLL